MLAQHMITKPVFEALFADFSFASHNPMSKAMQAVLDVLQQHHIDKEADTLQRFYDSVKMRASGIDSAQGKQKIVVELYDKFYRNAFPKMTERLGIVYTPVEVVDFIIHSVNDVLKSEFGETVGSDGVHIIDPFTGTGTFITRLLQSGLMTPDEIRKKYAGQLHANEIVLLAYYIAAINIESTYHGIVGGEYVPFDGICLTDTFQMYEKDDLVDQMLVDNSRRRKRQKKLDIRVIIGNPPYSVGQGDANANNQNVDYSSLDARIEQTYAARSAWTSVRHIYDSYIRAIRWASDRIGSSGVVGFVTNGGFVDGNAADGLRKCLADEFSSLYVMHLRGNARSAGEQRRKEAGNVFGAGSRAPIAISILVKNPKAANRGQIHFHDIGDYLSREQKLETIAGLGSIDGISNGPGWRMIQPDSHGDWLKQRDTSFVAYIPMGLKKSDGLAIFDNFGLGVATGRDVWCFNASKARVAENVERMIDFYSSERRRLAKAHPSATKMQRDELVGGFVDADPTEISWTRALKQDLAKDKEITFHDDRLRQAIYRPFHKQWIYFSRDLNEMVYQMPRIFPDATAKNLMIGVSAPGAISGFTAIMTDVPSELCLTAMKGGTQCFPLYLYGSEQPDETNAPLFVAGGKQAGPQRRDAITDEGLAHFREVYPGETITKEDLFYYVYGLLHSTEYRERFADNLGKELPRIPRVKAATDFWAFSKAGRALGDLHVNYEKAPIYDGAKVTHSNSKHDYRVEKMRYGGKGRSTDQDRTTLIYNETITVTGIPLEAYEYVVNGKPALDWVVERQCVKTDKDSGIVNDANDWAIETMKNPKYPLELFLRMITVSIETMKIVKSLPKLDIHEKG
jgi:predicted helicase